MKALVALIACSLVTACSSGNQAKILEPEVQFVQITGPSETMYQTGSIEVQYGMRIANRSSELITLERVEVSTVGAGGPYRVPRDYYYFNRPIAPGQFSDVAFWVRAVATATQYSIDAQAPVTVRAIAHFGTPNGAIRKILVVTFGQMGGPKER
jgi:hypothetical protein